MSDKSKVLFGGVTTQFDVKKLLDEIPINVGDLIEHGAVEELIGVKHGSGRYKSVTGAWRKALEKLNVELEAVPGVGYIVLDDRGLVKRGQKRADKGVRAIGGAAKTLSRVKAEKLDDAERKSFDHTQRAVVMLYEEAIKTKKTIAVRLGEFENKPKMRLVGK